MLSFSIINSETLGEVLKKLSFGVSPEVSGALSEMLEELCSSDEADVEYAASYSDGCLLIRIFDMGRYCFMFPYELSEEADLRAAVMKISEYAMREEIGIVFTDVPFDCLGVFSGFRHISADAEDSEATVYRVTLQNECELLSEIPALLVGRVELNRLSDADSEAFARLSKDSGVNKFWGYNYTDDVKNPPDDYFINTAREEFLRGTSMSCAVRYDGYFVGEVVFYAFDGMGASEFALRLLPEWQGKGLSGEIKDAIIAMGRKIGLTTLRAVIMKANKPSVSFASRFMTSYEEDEKTVKFKLDLYI